MKWRRVLVAVAVLAVVAFVGAVIIRRTQRDGLEVDVGEQITLETAAPGASQPLAMAVLTDRGGRVDWSEKLDLLAFDRKGEGGFFDVWTMKPDGSQQSCLTCDTPGLPQRNVGQPAWHPSGEYIVLQAEKPEHPGRSRAATPGIGVENNVWLITSDGARAFPITDLPDGTGVLHPHFSHDGTMLIWAEMIEAPPKGQALGGRWALKLADFRIDASGPQLTNLRTLQPNGDVFYESHGFTPDDSAILYTSVPEPVEPIWGFDIYRMDLRSGSVVNLTNSPDQWDEHAHISPSGEKIAWMSSRDCGCDPGKLQDLRTDLWMMNADGSGKTRLTHFSESGFPERLSKHVVTGDSAWSGDGRRLVVFTIARRGLLEFLNLRAELVPIVVLDFGSPQ